MMDTCTRALHWDLRNLLTNLSALSNSIGSITKMSNPRFWYVLSHRFGLLILFSWLHLTDTITSGGNMTGNWDVETLSV